MNQDARNPAMTLALTTPTSVVLDLEPVDARGARRHPWSRRKRSFRQRPWGIFASHAYQTHQHRSSPTF